MKKSIFITLLITSLAILAIIYGVDEIVSLVVSFLIRVFLFIKRNIIAFLISFFLVKGKFIFILFAKKIAILSSIGLSKRYVIERVIMKNFKSHFLDHLSDDIKLLINHAKENFKNFTIIKKLFTILAFIGSIGFVGKFMGGMLAIKVFLAKLWSFFLAIFIKFSSAFVYFFSDYLWNSWLAPIVEVVIFTWFLSILEKIPFLSKILYKVYGFFIGIFGGIERYMDKVLHIPIKKVLNYFVIKIRRKIYKFIGQKYLSIQKKLKQSRELNPNLHKKLLDKRKTRESKKDFIPIYKRLKNRK